MKILMLGWELPPYNSGGLGVACHQLCKALASQGADLEFILPFRYDRPIDFMTVTSTTDQAIQDIEYLSGAYDSQAFILKDGRIEWHDILTQQQHYEKAVSKIVASRTFDVIHAHDWLTFRAGLRARELSGKPLILHVHSIERDRAGGTRGNQLVREIEETGLLLADHIIAVSQLTKDAIVEEYHIPADRISVIHNSIDRSMLMDIDTSNSYPYLVEMRAQGYKVVSNVGRLTVQKGLPNLLRAAQLVVQKAPKTLFLLVGGGEQYEELIELAADLQIGRNVILTGFQRGKRWRDAFLNSDLFVMPSVSEPFGLTPLEAAHFGIPSLISRQSGINEVLKNCLRVDFWDINEMANQIIGTLQSPALQHELARNVVRELDWLNWDTAAEKVVRVYNKQFEGALV